jgi:soluble cytochrome b562
MADDITLPPDLIQLRKAFNAAQGRLRAAGQALPSYASIEAGEAEPATEEQRQEWQDAQEECRRLAREIDQHPHWAEAPDRKAARTALDAITEP